MPETATPGGGDDAALSEAGARRRAGRTSRSGAADAARGLLAAAAVIPLLLAAAGLGGIAVGIAAAAGFALLGMPALRRLRREQQALADENEAQADRLAALASANDRRDRRIDELARGKAAVEAASRARSELLADMEGELRTPLNAIIGFSGLIEREVLGPVGNPKYREYAVDIASSGRHLLALIGDLLDVVRLDAGRLPLQEDTVAVEGAVEEALLLIGPQAERGGVALAWQPPRTALPPLRCDRMRLRQVLLNVLASAVKVTEPGGSVAVTAEVNDGLEISVRDTGTGMEPGDIRGMMTPFGRAAALPSRNPEPTGDAAGLGLALTRALVERHGGNIALDGTPGIGTTVRLSFPAERVMRTGPTEIGVSR
jgi:signal transduction histidine kinase